MKIKGIEKNRIVFKVETNIIKADLIEGKLRLSLSPPLFEHGAIYDFDIPEVNMKGRAVFISESELELWELNEMEV